MRDFRLNFIFAPDASVGEQWTPVGTLSFFLFWRLWATRMPTGSGWYSTNFLSPKALLGGCLWVITSCSSDPAAFIVNSGTNVMACRECVKWFHQKQSTADQQAHSDSLKGSQPEMLSGSEGTYHNCGALPVNTVNFMFFLSFFVCHF